MFRSLMTIIRELYLHLTAVIFMLKHSVKLRRYIYLVMWQHAATSPNIYNDDKLPLHAVLSYFVAEA